MRGCISVPREVLALDWHPIVPELLTEFVSLVKVEILHIRVSLRPSLES